MEPSVKRDRRALTILGGFNPTAEQLEEGRLGLLEDLDELEAAGENVQWLREVLERTE